MAQGKLLILSVGYGQGHHSAARAIAEYYVAEGWECTISDPCADAHPVLFRLTQFFYQFCVRKAPWLWGVMYSLTGNADWAGMVQRPLFCSLRSHVCRLLDETSPDLILCTYPLFAYLLDDLKAKGETVAPYAVVVTDAREISRPWMRSEASLVVVPDSESGNRMRERYALSPCAVVATGFPVRSCFRPSAERTPPGSQEITVVYGAFRRIGGVVDDIRALLGSFPQLKLTVLAGERAGMLKRVFFAECSLGRLQVVAETNQMTDLLSAAHVYIGKAGAATVFECYASHTPVLVNYVLPGQEEGNLELLLDDGAGRHVESTSHLVATLQQLVQDDAVVWRRMSQAMQKAERSDGARRIARTIRQMYGI